MNIQIKLLSMIALVLICILSAIFITTNVNRDIAYLNERKNDALEFRNTWLTFTGVNKSLLITDISDPGYLIFLSKHKSLLAEITKTISNINSNIYLKEVDKELAEAYRNSSFIWDLSRDDFNQAQILLNSDLLRTINQKARYGSIIEIKERFKSKGSTREFLELNELMNRILSLSSANDSFNNSLDNLISIINKKITAQESFSQKVYLFVSIFLVSIVTISLLLFGNQIVKNLKIVIERNKEIEERKKVEVALRKSEFEQMQYQERLENLVEVRTADLTEAVDKLRKQALFTETVLDNVRDGVVACDAQGALSYFNRATRELHGIEQEELPAAEWAQHYRLLLKDGMTPMPTQEVPLFRAFNGENVHDQILIIEHANGSKHAMLCSGQRLVDKDGSRIGAVVSMHDITRQMAVESELIDARDVAEAANRAKSTFLASMSHELRTPMNGILGFGQLLQYDQTLTSEQHDWVGEITNAGKHLLELINEVLDLAKVESGQIELSLEPVEVSTVVTECLSLIAPLAGKRNIGIRFDELKDAAVRADRTRLKQVLLNLLSNAIKYNREGGSVKLDVRNEGAERLRILVTDSGQGIPANRMQELFLPFNRLDATNSNIEGTGIGLTITRRIVEMMGGTVDVRSEVGVGSTFWIELPVESMEKNADAARKPTTSDSSLAASNPDTPVKTVLYIEDNPSNLKLVAMILGQRKHIHLLTAHTPDLGIELAISHKPDLILLDINMPGMDGYQVLEILKAEASLKNTPVVAITANAMPRDIERGIAAGFNDYMTKPLDLIKFYALLDKLLASDSN